MTKSSRFLLIIIFVVGFLWALLANAPARLALAYANQFSPDIYASGVSGTIWDGKAAQLIVRVNGVAQDLGEVQWQLAKLPLLWGSADVNASTNQRDIKTEFSAVANVFSKSATVSEAKFKLPVPLLRQFYPLPFTMEGTVDGRVERAVLANESLEDVKGNVVWQNAMVNVGTGDQMLGDFVAEFAHQDDHSLLVELSELKGQLGLKGDIKIGADQKTYQANLNFKPDPALNPQVRSMLAQLGQANNAGEIQFKHQGRL